MGKYIKCPRCELNWILDTAEYCDVCKAELGMEGFTLLEDEEEDILCPVCGINYIERNKKMCADCFAKSKSGDVSYAGDTESELDSQSENSQVDVEEGIEKISFDEIDEEEKFDIYDDAFDDQDDFSANDFSKEGFEDEEEPEEDEEEEIVNSEDDELEADFNYDIDAVDDIDEDEEDEEEDADED